MLFTEVVVIFSELEKVMFDVAAACASGIEKPKSMEIHKRFRIKATLNHLYRFLNFTSKF
jgi:hypothetical protein